jgi:hypothetical protein
LDTLFYELILSPFPVLSTVSTPPLSFLVLTPAHSRPQMADEHSVGGLDEEEDLDIYLVSKEKERFKVPSSLHCHHNH